ncbi:hypothetical protein GDO86_014781 [Hymenochirus boettgeri]|uniref:Uncharacterized protein n=1 Tax=Hymenochirus boettgeri TaxID=247094 RepID=A0A8T2JU44_9PIPI|nr:hypothetical protein GDO86_014781 [Hymenochirus boettgeri]
MKREINQSQTLILALFLIFRLKGSLFCYDRTKHRIIVQYLTCVCDIHINVILYVKNTNHVQCLVIVFVDSPMSTVG